MRRLRIGRRFARLTTFNLLRRDDAGLTVFRLLLSRKGAAGFVRYDRLPVPLTLHRAAAKPRLRRVA